MKRWFSPFVPLEVPEKTVPLRLQVLNGEEASRLLSLTEFPCLLGRGGTSTIILSDPETDPTLSREHALLTRQGTQLFIADQSLNGTRIGSRRLCAGERGVWEPGVVVTLGSSLCLRYLETTGVLPNTRERGFSRETLPLTTRSMPLSDLARSPGLPVFSPSVPKKEFRQQLLDLDLLQMAWKRVALNRGAAGVDQVTLREYGVGVERRLTQLQNELKRGRYEPLPPRRFALPKRTGGVRVISILTVRDRIVQHALQSALQPWLDPLFPACSFAYRPGKGAHDALRQVDTLLKSGLEWIVETDIDSYFDRISHSLLLDKLAQVAPDPFLLSLVARCLASGATEVGKGLPQGAATSPLFSNLYLAEFDHALLERGESPVRYGDDLLLACKSRNRAQAALSEVEGFLQNRLFLSLKPEKTAILPLKAGFTFLGFRFTEAGRRASPEALAQLETGLQRADPSQTRAVKQGWQNYFGSPPEEAAPEPSFPLPSAPVSAVSSEVTLRFLELFRGRETAYARLSAVRGKTYFSPCEGALTQEHLRRHWRGEETLSLYLLGEDGGTRLLVIDLDSLEKGQEVQGQTLVIAHAQKIAQMCRQLGLPVSLEESGRKGAHLWVFFSELIAPETARKLGRLILLRAGTPFPEMRAEIFPRHTEWPGAELGDAIKLPYGVHPVTGRRCFFLDEEGEAIPTVAEALKGIRTISRSEVEGIIATLSRSPGKNPSPKQNFSVVTSRVEAVFSGCTVVQGLVEKAQRNGHLRHTHQLILLYTMGPLGEEGAKFIHETIAQCRNYVPSVCQGYLDRLEKSHSPITCRRIREWLEEEGEGSLCTCMGKRRSPLELIPLKSERNPALTSVEHSLISDLETEAKKKAEIALLQKQAAEWSDLQRDLFGETEDGEETDPKEVTL